MERMDMGGEIQARREANPTMDIQQWTYNNGHHGQTPFVRGVNKSTKTQMKMDHCCPFFCWAEQISFVVANKRKRTSDMKRGKKR